MTHALASSQPHDGSGILLLLLGLIFTLPGFLFIINFHGVNDDAMWGRKRDIPMPSVVSRAFGVIFFFGGIASLVYAIHRFMHGGY